MATLVSLLRSEVADDSSSGCRCVFLLLSFIGLTSTSISLRDCFAVFLRQDTFALLVECARLPGSVTAALFLKTIYKLVDMYNAELLLVARAGSGGSSNNLSLLFNLINHLHSSAATKEITGDFPFLRSSPHTTNLPFRTHVISCPAHRFSAQKLALGARHVAHGYHVHAGLFLWRSAAPPGAAAARRFLPNRHPGSNRVQGQESCASAAAGLTAALQW